VRTAAQVEKHWSTATKCTVVGPPLSFQLSCQPWGDQFLKMCNAVMFCVIWTCSYSERLSWKATAELLMMMFSSVVHWWPSFCSKSERVKLVFYCMSFNVPVWVCFTATLKCNHTNRGTRREVAAHPTWKISGQALFSGQAQVAQKSWMIKNISIQWKIQGNPVFEGKRKLLKNPEC